MRYLVDVGRLVPVMDVTPRAALQLALLDLGCKTRVDLSFPVYELDEEGKVVLGVVLCDT
jgi:hypothetical protein